MVWDFHRDLYTHEIWIPGKRWMNPMLWPWHIGFLFPFLVWWWSSTCVSFAKRRRISGQFINVHHPHDSQPFPWFIPMTSQHFPRFLCLKYVEICWNHRKKLSTILPGGQSGFDWETHVGRLGKWLESSEVSVNGNCSMVKSNVSVNMCLMVNSPL